MSAARSPAAGRRLIRQLGTEVYFCDPHSPWQKGAVENANSRIHLFLPSDRNLAELAEDDLVGIVGVLNTTPRRCLGYRTPKEALLARMTMTMGGSF
jgi:transposase, IS30 family